MPAHGARQMLNEENMIMKFRSFGGKQVTYHQAMNYLYRPKEMEDSAMYKFYTEVDFTSLREAKKSDTECYKFTEEHPFHEIDTVIYRVQEGKQDRVPVFSWTFIGSTKGFERSMLEEVSPTDPQYHKKEEYAQRFMIVFLPFRTKEDLTIDGSYQRAFQTAYKEGRFSDEMIAIANNIQAIQNSIESGIPENCLSSRTILPEAEEFEIDDNEESQLAYEDLLSTVGDLLAPVTDGVRLESDATSFNPDFSGKQLQGPRFIPEKETEEEQKKKKESFRSVTQRLEAFEVFDDQSSSQTDPTLPVRFRTGTSELNSLLMRQENVVIAEEGADGGEGADAEVQVPLAAPDACGSWQSIVKWGQNKKMDAEQQVAFEILVATYVLTFYDEAENTLADGSEDDTIINRERLLELARKDPKSKTPLRMFVTGPAGAGKCKKQCVAFFELSQM
jgi:hypothetical protein